jgi:hypothetical protein
MMVQGFRSSMKIRCFTLQKMVYQMGIKWKDKLPKHLGLIEQLIKPPLECLPTNWSTEDMSLAG